MSAILIALWAVGSLLLITLARLIIGKHYFDVAMRLYGQAEVAYRNANNAYRSASLDWEMREAKLRDGDMHYRAGDAFSRAAGKARRKGDRWTLGITRIGR